MFDAGIRVHPSTPASARLAPSSFMKLRRLPPSRWTISSRVTLNAGPSSMTGRAREQTLDVVARRDRASAREVSAHPPGNARRSRRDVSLRRAMALHAPLHRQRRGLINLLHRLHGTVARLTVDAVLHVNRMIEEDEVRHARDALPRNRLARRKALADRGEQIRGDRRVVMARHARSGRR